MQDHRRRRHEEMKRVKSEISKLVKTEIKKEDDDIIVKYSEEKKVATKSSPNEIFYKIKV